MILETDKIRDREAGRTGGPGSGCDDVASYVLRAGAGIPLSPSGESNPGPIHYE